MKIAIPVFGTRISPRFDCAREFLIVTAENGEVIARQGLQADAWSPLIRIRKLSSLGIDTLICSGIDRASWRHLKFSGIRIYSWVTGEVEDALRCLFKGELESGIMTGHGGHRCGRWRFMGNGDPWSDGRPESERCRGRGGGPGRGRSRR